MADPGFLQMWEMWVIDGDVKSYFRIGVVGNGGSGKTLILKILFSSQKVRLLFSDGFLLWLTVSQSPSFTILGDKLRSKTKIDLVQNMKKEDAKMWLNQRIQEKKFALFLNDVWGEGGKLLEELGVTLLTEHSNSKIIVSSRDRRALLEMGVSENSTITMGDLVQEKSWNLLVHHSFPYNNGNLPANTDQLRARVVCAKCGGLPLAIKLVGRSMAGVTDAHEWQLPLYDRLRWSYDSLELCFLYLAAAFIDQQVIYVEILIWLWIGQGLLAEEGAIKLRLGTQKPTRADRCLIEPILRDIDGRVLFTRCGDVYR